MDRCDVAVVGSGFGGSILARVLRRLGRDVVLIERGAHPRFALGESSTPLANLCLERLGRHYELSDLVELAAYGRWLEAHPELRRGLKRGFSFYLHRPGEVYRNGAANDRRLLVAASPSDAVADSHWLREDVDRHLVERAVAEGVRYLDRTALDRVEPDGEGWRLGGMREGESLELRAAVVVDASGAGGFLATHLPIASALDRVALDTSLVFGHFEGVPDFAETAPGPEAAFAPGPYPDDRAAVHHLLEEGWLYALPFDHGVVSAGILLEAGSAAGGPSEEPPEGVWSRVLGRYPTLAAQFGSARTLFPLRRMARVQHRLAAAAGPGWALLPHAYAFIDPMYSTGIAWTLLGVERLGLVFEALALDGELAPRALDEAFDRYGERLREEADQMERLLEAAYRTRRDFELFAGVSALYFAAVSWAETDQRLRPEGRDGLAPAWQGFLGTGDAVFGPLFAAALERLRALPLDAEGRADPAERERFATWVRESIAPRNVAGLADPARENLYPVDLDLLVERAGLLGLTAEEVRAALPRLRGAVPVS